MRVAIGSDHAGFDLKQGLIQRLQDGGHEVLDLGTDGPQSVDYPDFGVAVAQKVVDGDADRGVLVCGTGIGIGIAANKVSGARVATCNDLFTARMSRQHNDANVVSLGSRVVGPGVAEEIVHLFLETEFEGGRHARRVDRIHALESPSGS